MKKIIFLNLIILLIIEGCTSKVDFKTEEQAIRSISMKWLELEKNRDAVGISALFSDDGIAIRQDQQPVGQTAIQKYIIEYWEKNPKVIPTWTTDHIDIANSGDMGIEYGNYKSTNLGPDGTKEDYGRYVTIFRKLNGTWKISCDIGQSTKPVEVTQ